MTPAPTSTKLIPTTTRKEAIQRCLEMWSWIYEENRKGNTVFKGEWPGWRKYESVRNNCFACEISIRRNRSTCFDCFLIKIWPDFCVNINSPYRKWALAYGENNAREASTYAKVIVDECKRLLKLKKYS